jgi:hypothetical protein
VKTIDLPRQARDKHREKLRQEGVFLQVAIDLGDVHSPVTPIHPRRKSEVGRRLALSALAVQYGRKDVVSTGPVFASISADATAAAPAAAGGAGTTVTVSYTSGTAYSLHSAVRCMTTTARSAYFRGARSALL